MKTLVETIEHVVTVVLVVVLLLGWALTSPLLKLGERIAYRIKLKTAKQVKN